MTNEQAKSLLLQVKHILINNNSWLENTHEPLNIAFDMAIKALESQIEFIDKIPKDYKYDTETSEFYVYRHKYNGDEIHIIKEPTICVLNQEPCEDCIIRQAAKSKAVYSHERHEKVVPVAELDWLPSIEPEKCGDCISRSAIIGKCEDTAKATSESGEINTGFIMALDFIADYAKHTPSVEPERNVDLIDKEIPIEEYDDCIRRKDVLWITKETGALETQARVVKLPSVEPERKAGKWIDISRDDDIEEFYCCSLCKREIILYPGETLKDYPYCHCGARMEVNG